MSQAKKQNRTIGTVRKAQITKGDKAGQDLVKIQFNKNLKLLYVEKDGTENELDLGEYNSVILKSAQEMCEALEYKASQGWITEEKAEEDKQFIEDKRIAYEITLPVK